MTNYAQTERHALADLFDEVGPDAPTLCGDWTTADLAAHLVVRERRPDGAVGILASPLAGYAEKVRLGARDGNRWPDLVNKVRNGPPVFLKPLDAPVNTVEYLVHHEDVRRAGPDWEPRILDAAEEAVLWSRLGLMGRVLLRRSPVGVELVGPGHGRSRPKAGDGVGDGDGAAQRAPAVRLRPPGPVPGQPGRRRGVGGAPPDRVPGAVAESAVVEPADRLVEARICQARG